MERFNGRVAVVTGSNAGIGAAITKELVKNGLIVAGLARREDKLQEFKEELEKLGYHNKFHPIKCDVTNENDIISAFRKINEDIGRLSILINNAGVFRGPPLHESEDREIEEILHINVKGVILCAREAIRIMRENSIDGHIVNICSIAGQCSWIPRLPAALYSATKHAVRVISDGLRREMILKGLKIKVSNLSPGTVETDMTVGVGYIKSLDSSKYLQAQDVAHACISILNTPLNVVISELVILPVNELI